MKLTHALVGLASAWLAVDNAAGQTTGFPAHSPTARRTTPAATTPRGPLDSRFAPAAGTPVPTGSPIATTREPLVPLDASGAIAPNVTGPTANDAVIPTGAVTAEVAPRRATLGLRNGLLKRESMRTAQLANPRPTGTSPTLGATPPTSGMPLPESLPAPTPQPYYPSPALPTVTLPAGSAPITTSVGGAYPPGAGFAPYGNPVAPGAVQYFGQPTSPIAPGPGLAPGSVFQQPLSMPSQGAMTAAPFAGAHYGGDPSTGLNTCGPEGCDPGGCDPGCCDPGPRWFGSLGGLLMTRTRPNGLGLAYVGADSSQIVLNSRSTVPGQWQGGFEARIGRRIGESAAVEGSYWMLNEFFSQTAYVTNPAVANINSTLDFTTGGPVIVDARPATDFFVGSTEQRLERRDEIWNGEVNWLNQPWFDDEASRWSFLSIAGLRWFHFREGTRYLGVVGGTTYGEFDDLGNTAHYDISTRNDLVGGQLGTRVQYRVRPNWRLYATPKFAVMANSIRMNQSLHCGCADGGTEGFTYSTYKNEASLLGQIDIGTQWQITPRLSAYIAYRALTVSNLALADDQYARYVSDANSENTIHSNGSLILHGGMFGGQFAY